MSSTSITADDASWLDLFRGANALRVLVLAAGVALHAINLYLTTTILPSVVDDIGGVAFYAWNTTLFIVASITGAAVAAQVIQHLGPRGAYLLGAMVFGGGSALCALTPTMPVLLVGRVLQGLGGGVLLSAPYVLMRSVLPEPLWPRALALLSGMWGIATLLGPAVGGIFAQYATWRLAFWSLVVLIALAAAAAVVVLKPAAPQAERPTPVPTRQLVLLAVAVVAASWASVSDSPWLGALGLIAAALTLLAIRRVEMRSSRRILPADAYTGRTALAALYGVSALLAVTVTCTEIFVPLFLQRLHGQSPLIAGYIAATASAGWTLGAILSAALRAASVTRAIRLAPWACALGLLVLAMLVPIGAGSAWMTTLIIVALTLVGLGVGVVWPHLGNRIMTAAPAEDHDRASASIVTVQLVATALGAALGGVVLNTLGAAGSAPDLGAASRWLFLLFAVAPVGALVIAHTGLRTRLTSSTR
ncbi:MFS transporter [Ralstonia nicotianae]|uniref:MFS transporter n=1 Tax=Ralstonia nicotianae TaxID=3037696 RepID=A0ABX7ZSB7_9RALS|nr:MFS transporter [Ralstonia nicotianae]QUP58015.1 MFS transporter [Ralstonia nicotianae]